MTILVYGFGPYRQFTDNVTEKIVSQLGEIDRVHRVVFPVAFDRGMFTGEFERVKPDLIIGLGQHSRAKKIRIERRARNMQRADKGTPKRIQRGNDKRMSLALPKLSGTTVTYDAGDYVCNYSMWMAESYAEMHDAKAAFLHIPRDLDVSEGVRFMKRLLRELRASRDDP